LTPHKLQKKKILYIAPDISVKGGISTVIKGFISSQLTQKYNIILIASHVDGSKPRKLVQAIAGLLKTTYYLTFKNIGIVHMHGGDITSVMRKYFYFRLVKLFKKKLIYHSHGGSLFEQYSNASPAWQRRIRQLLEDSDLVIGLSASWRNAIRAIAPKSNFQVIYNSVPLPVLEKEKRNETKVVNITFLGLVCERKGIFDLIEVLSRIILNGYDVHLTVGGDGDINRLNDEVKSNNLKNRVTYVGWIVGDAKDKLLRNTDIFVLPSYGEGMPMTILEAMSYAIPVISTNVGGVPELVLEEQTGYLVEPGNLDGLFQQMKRLIEDSHLRISMGLKGREVIEKDFNLNINEKKIETIYDTI